MRFIELDGFSQDWRRLRLGDEDLRRLENLILKHPAGAPVVSGCGGIRKLRFSPEAWQRGKSGAIRVLYALFDNRSVVVLAAAYAKSDQADLSSEHRAGLRGLMKEIAKLLEEGQ